MISRASFVSRFGAPVRWTAFVLIHLVLIPTAMASGVKAKPKDSDTEEERRAYLESLLSILG